MNNAKACCLTLGSELVMSVAILRTSDFVRAELQSGAWKFAATADSDERARGGFVYFVLFEAFEIFLGFKLPPFLKCSRYLASSFLVKISAPSSPPPTRFIADANTS